MSIKSVYRICLLAIALQCGSCTAVNIIKYYERNQPTLDSIRYCFHEAYMERPFSIEFTNRTFHRVSLELETDTLKYIYEFNVGEPRMQDTLLKFGFRPERIAALIRQMNAGQCTWVNQMEFYTDGQQHSLTYISLWPRSINSPFANKKYYILAYFNEPQFFDSRGNLLSGRRRKRVRKINTDVFKRINDTVCYTLSDRFR